MPASEGIDVPRLAGLFGSVVAQLPESLRSKVVKLVHLIQTEIVGVKEYEIQGSAVEVAAQITRIRLHPQFEEIVVHYANQNDRFKFGMMSSGQRRLLDSTVSSLVAMSWQTLRDQVGTAAGPRIQKQQVFISYRSGRGEIAEAVARRLGEEGFIPWFDKWDVQAGDSLPGKIEEAFADSVAFVPIITSDYKQGAWATEELRTAISKRINEGFRIVPILFERCEKPELLKHLVHVDMTDHDPQGFESKMAEVIDGIFALSVNPFRS